MTDQHEVYIHTWKKGWDDLEKSLKYKQTNKWENKKNVSLTSFYKNNILVSFIRAIRNTSYIVTENYFHSTSSFDPIKQSFFPVKVYSLKVLEST